MKLYLILLLAFLTATASAQTRVEKRNGIWYIIKTEVLTDTSQIPDPSKPPIVVVPPIDPPTTGFPGPVINVLPGQSISSAVARASAGTWVTIQAGTYNEPNIVVPAGVNIWGVGDVFINAMTPGAYGVNGENGTTALLALSSSSRIAGNQRIHNLKLRGSAGKGVGGIMVNQRNNVVITKVDVQNFNFSGIWVMYSDNVTVSGAILNNNSWSSIGWASGEFNFVEVNNFLFRDIIATSSSPSKGYGFKALWSGKKNLYNGVFRKIETRMHHASNWNNGQSYNIGFEIHDTKLQGNIVVDSSYFENQISIVIPEANVGSITFQNSRHDGKNDRYTFELWLNNFKTKNFTSINSSQFAFNVEHTRSVNNWLIESTKWTQGTAGMMSWGAPFLFGNGGKTNIVLQGSTFTSSYPATLTYKPNNTGIIIR